MAILADAAAIGFAGLVATCHFLVSKCLLLATLIIVLSALSDRSPFVSVCCFPTLSVKTSRICYLFPTQTFTGSITVTS